MLDLLFEDAWAPIMQKLNLDQKKKFGVFFYSLLILAFLLDFLLIGSYFRFFSYTLILGITLMINEKKFYNILDISIWEVLLGVMIIIFSLTLLTPLKWQFFPTTKAFGVINGGTLIMGYIIIFYGLKKYRIVFPFYLFYGVLVLLNGAWGSVLEPLAQEYISPITAHLAYLLISFFGYPAIINGNTITIIRENGDSISATVAGACSGIMGVTLFSVMIIGLLIGSKIKYLLRSMFIIMGAVIIFLLNIMRISLIFILAYYYGQDGFNWGHHWLGSIMFLTFVLGYWYLIDKKIIQKKVNINEKE